VDLGPAGYAGLCAKSLFIARYRLDEEFDVLRSLRPRTNDTPRPWREIALAWRLLAPERRLRLLLAERSGVVIGAAIALITGRRTELRYLTSAQSGLRHRPNHALYWSAIRMAADEGCTAIDFGNGSGSLVFFKRRWGCESEGLYRYVLGPGRGADQPVPRLDTDPSDGGEPKTAALRRRLPPPLARLGGALVYRYL
jgi:hypothetical protein